jgi:membrane associated rhomboid family serine protease
MILIAVTVAISLLGFAVPQLWRAMALEPYRMFATHQYHQVVTAGLLHADVFHLFLNMYVLYSFGRGLEPAFGSERYLIIYLVSMVVGNLYPLIKYRNNPEYIAIGASGAVSGILFSFCLIAPTAMLRVMFMIPMPAFIFAILYVAYSIYSMRRVKDNIGHEAHLAGAFAGVITTLIIVPEVAANLGSYLR